MHPIRSCLVAAMTRCDAPIDAAACRRAAGRAHAAPSRERDRERGWSDLDAFWSPLADPRIHVLLPCARRQPRGEPQRRRRRPRLGTGGAHPVPDVAPPVDMGASWGPAPLPHPGEGAFGVVAATR